MNGAEVDLFSCHVMRLVCAVTVTSRDVMADARPFTRKIRQTTAKLHVLLHVVPQCSYVAKTIYYRCFRQFSNGPYKLVLRELELDVPGSKQLRQTIIRVLLFHGFTVEEATADERRVCCSARILHRPEATLNDGVDSCKTSTITFWTIGIYETSTTSNDTE